MEPFVRDEDFTLWNGDSLTVLRDLPDESIHCALTSPPFYALRDYGVEGQIGLEATPEAWVAALVAVFRELRRVLRKDGTLWVECGDSYNSGTRARRKASDVPNHGYWENGGTMGDERINAPGLKPKDLLLQPFMLAMALRADGWWLRQVIVWHKCLSGGTMLYARTQKGEMPQTLKDLVRLNPSTVELWTGERWTPVVSWSPAERETQVEVEFRNGERVGCTPEHRWPTQRGLLRADELVSGDIVQRAVLPAPSEPRGFLEDAEIGYLVGLYLAEGSLSGDTVQIACHADAADGLAERLGRTTALLHGTATAHRTGGKRATVNLNGPLSAAAISAYVAGNGAKRKHLAPRAWSRSNSFLRALLDGYLDGDGHWDGARWRLGFTQNDALATDLRTLGARLGVSVRLRRCVHRCQTGDFPGWRGSVSTHERRKQPDTQVVAIRKSRARRFWDVQVADEPHLFALASGALTHNSNAMPESATDRCTTAHSYVFLLSKSPRYFFDADAISEPAAWERWGDQTTPKHEGTPTGSGWIAPKSKKELLADHADRSNHRLASVTKQNHSSHLGRETGEGRKNARSVWTIPTQGYAEAHFATWPEALVERILLAGTSEKGCCPGCGAPWEREISQEENIHPGDSGRNDLQGDVQRGKRSDGKAVGTIMRERFEAGRGRTTTGWRPTCACFPGIVDGYFCPENRPVPCTVLDPFMGSGTTALVARTLGRKSVGIELNADYCTLAARRLQQLSLLA